MPYLLKLFRDSDMRVCIDLPPRRTYNGWRHLHLRPVGTGHIQTYKTFRHEKLYNGCKYRLQHILQPAAAETVDGIMVRSYIAGKPHEADVIATEFFYATAGIDITQMHRQESEASCVGGTQNSLQGNTYGKVLQGLSVQ